MTCPGCGSTLRALTGPSSWAPWACDECARGWWPAELEAGARDGWDPASRSFDVGLADDVRAGVGRDRQAAAERGVSLLDSQVEDLDAATLATVAGDERVDAELRDRVRAVVAARPAARPARRR